MGRSHISPIQQPSDYTCGPVSLKIALEIFGRHKSLEYLIELCKTNRNGTTTQNLINAFNKLGYPVLAIEYATLKHLQSALRYKSNKIRAVLVSYLYDLKENKLPHPDSGHFAVVSSYMTDKSRIVLLDSASAQKKSYAWSDFRNRWFDYDLKRRRIKKRGKKFQLIRKWQPQLMLVVAKKTPYLPKFDISSQRLFLPVK